MKGFGIDEDIIIDIIIYCSNVQWQQIWQIFKFYFGWDLMSDLKFEIFGDLVRLILGFMMLLVYYDVKQLKKVMEGVGIDEKVFIEILVI